MVGDDKGDEENGVLLRLLSQVVHEQNEQLSVVNHLPEEHGQVTDQLSRLALRVANQGIVQIRQHNLSHVQAAACVQNVEVNELRLRHRPRAAENVEEQKADRSDQGPRNHELELGPKKQNFPHSLCFVLPYDLDGDA